MASVLLAVGLVLTLDGVLSPLRFSLWACLELLVDAVAAVVDVFLSSVCVLLVVGSVPPLDVALPLFRLLFGVESLVVDAGGPSLCFLFGVACVLVVNVTFSLSCFRFAVGVIFLADVLSLLQVIFTVGSIPPVEVGFTPLDFSYGAGLVLPRVIVPSLGSLFEVGSVLPLDVVFSLLHLLLFVGSLFLHSSSGVSLVPRADVVVLSWDFSVDVTSVLLVDVRFPLLHVLLSIDSTLPVVVCTTPWLLLFVVGASFPFDAASSSSLHFSFGVGLVPLADVAVLSLNVCVDAVRSPLCVLLAVSTVPLVDGIFLLLGFPFGVVSASVFDVTFSSLRVLHGV